MRLKASIISILLTFNAVSVWSSDSDPYDQIDVPNLTRSESTEILKDNIDKTLETHYFLENNRLHTQLSRTDKYLERIDLAIYDDISIEMVVLLQKQMGIDELSLRDSKLLKSLV